MDQRYYGILSALAPLPLVLLFVFFLKQIPKILNNNKNNDNNREKGVDYINFMELNENDIETLKYAKFLIGHHTSQQEISFVSSFLLLAITKIN